MSERTDLPSISRLDSDRDAVIIGVDSGPVSALISIEPRAAPVDIERVIRTAYQEARHSAKVRSLGATDADVSDAVEEVSGDD